MLILRYAGHILNRRAPENTSVCGQADEKSPKRTEYRKSKMKEEKGEKRRIVLESKKRQFHEEENVQQSQRLLTSRVKNRLLT